MCQNIAKSGIFGAAHEQISSRSVCRVQVQQVLSSLPHGGGQKRALAQRSQTQEEM